MRFTVKIQDAFLLSFIFVSGCGSVKDSSRIVPDNGFASDPVNYTEVSRTLLSEQNYFVSYSQSSGRLAIIDADSFNEIWGSYTSKQMPYVFNLPGHEGAGLVGPGEFQVIIREGSRRFTFPGSEHLVWNRARDAIAVAAYDSERKLINAVKFRGDNNWEEAEISPFPEGMSFSDDGTVVIGSSGTLMLVLGPVSGSYVIIADGEGKLANRRTCLNSGMPDGEIIDGAFVDEGSETAILSLGSKMLQLDLSAAGSCAEPSSWKEVYSGGKELTRVGLLRDGMIYALDVSESSPGKMHIFENKQGAVGFSRVVDTGCVEPVAVNSFGSDLYTVLCVNRITDEYAGVPYDSIKNASLQFIDESGKLSLSRDIEFDKKSGVVFNSQKSEFLEIYDSAAGEVKVHSVPSGETRKIEGIFMGGILDRL